MPTYTVYVAHRVIEEGSIDIEAPNKHEALTIAAGIDLGKVDRWNYNDNDGPHWVSAIKSEDGEWLDQDDDEDADGATPSPVEDDEEW